MNGVGDDALVFDGHARHPTIGGPKFYKRHGHYYIFAPGGGVPTGWQTVLRSRHVRSCCACRSMTFSLIRLLLHQYLLVKFNKGFVQKQRYAL